jgi:threonine aldolase
MLLSTKERVAEARVWRKRYGAGMRQVGILAAAINFALDNNIPSLAEDHRRAREIAAACAQVQSSVVDLKYVHTNIVVLELGGSSKTAQQINLQLKDAGILASALGPHTLRLVTHRDLTDADISKTNSVLPDLLQRAFKA